MSDKRLSNLWVCIICIHVLKRKHHCVDLIRRHELRIPRQPIHRIEFICECVIQGTNNFGSVNSMFIYEFLEESPQLVGLIDQSVESGVVSEEILHFSDGCCGLKVIVLESQELLLLSISSDDQSILAI